MVRVTVPARSRVSPNPRRAPRAQRNHGGESLPSLHRPHPLSEISLLHFPGRVKIRAGTPAISVRLAVYVFSSSLRSRWIAFGISLGEASLSSIPLQDACCLVFLVSTMQPAPDQVALMREHAAIAWWWHLRMPCSAVLDCLPELRLTISRKCVNVERARLTQTNTDSTLPK